jgi:hypothetical protein
MSLGSLGGDLAVRGLPGRFEIADGIACPPRPDGGGTTVELPLLGRHPARTGSYVYGRRLATTFSGRHYHRGQSASKNPELFLLLSGRATWRVADLSDWLKAVDGEAESAGKWAMGGASSSEESLDLPPGFSLGGGSVFGKDRPKPVTRSFEVTGPCTIVIYPGVWHELFAHTAIEFIELNSIEDHARDTFTDWEPEEA